MAGGNKIKKRKEHPPKTLTSPRKHKTQAEQAPEEGEEKPTQVAMASGSQERSESGPRAGTGT